jgi:L-fuconolactonase
MDIVDAQVHLGRTAVDSTLETMDALGIASAVLDEFWAVFRDSGPTHFEPGYLLENGAWRAVSPTAEGASLVHPDRFSYVVRVDRRDPQLESVLRCVASSPHARAIRVLPVWTLEEVKAFADGAYHSVLEIADELSLPVFMYIPGYVDLLRRYAERFPAVSLVVDHCGMGFPGIPEGRDPVEATASQDVSYFDRVLRIAELPNVALKWGHAPRAFGPQTYPYDALRPVLRSAIEAFGAERIMWASDKTIMAYFGHTWSNLLTCLSHDSELTVSEREWILGGAARRVLNWPIPE